MDSFFQGMKHEIGLATAFVCLGADDDLTAFINPKKRCLERKGPIVVNCLLCGGGGVHFNFSWGKW